MKQSINRLPHQSCGSNSGRAQERQTTRGAPPRSGPPGAGRGQSFVRSCLDHCLRLSSAAGRTQRRVRPRLTRPSQQTVSTKPRATKWGTGRSALRAAEPWRTSSWS